MQSSVKKKTQKTSRINQAAIASGAGSYWVLTRLRSLANVINTLNGERQLVTAALRHPNFLDAPSSTAGTTREISASFTPPAVIHLVSSALSRGLSPETPDDPARRSFRQLPRAIARAPRAPRSAATVSRRSNSCKRKRKSFLAICRFLYANRRYLWCADGS